MTTVVFEKFKPNVEFCLSKLDISLVEIVANMTDRSIEMDVRQNATGPEKV